MELILVNKFDFYNPTHIVFGKDRLKELDKLVPQSAVCWYCMAAGVQAYWDYSKGS
jgi:alcohol dehydrogenase YqhD (iron-dependent ADH family)